MKKTFKIEMEHGTVERTLRQYVAATALAARRKFAKAVTVTADQVDDFVAAFVTINVEVECRQAVHARTVRRLTTGEFSILR